MSVLALALVIFTADPLPVQMFEAPKYGFKTEIPVAWPLAIRERDDRVFVALIPQSDPDRPGIVACELAIAPETLDEYRTRLEGAAQRNGRPGGKLAKNEVVKTPTGEQLETIWEFRPRDAGLWRELSVRLVSHRQMYTFTLNADEMTYPGAKEAFDKLIAAAKFSPPNTGATADPKIKNRWIQHEFGFAIGLPQGWTPVLAPNEVALFYANGPAHGIWSDNVLVLGSEGRQQDLDELARTLPEQLREVEPKCEILSCAVVDQGKRKALETVVRTQRGPFSMTVLERRFHGETINYEVKYTVESKRFDELAPSLRESLDSFGEQPAKPPAVIPKRAG